MTVLMSRRQALAGTLLAVPALARLARGAQAAAGPAPLAGVVEAAVAPVMAEHGIPGLAVGVTANGERSVFNYGVASQESGRKVDDRTLFEVGSISKTFTATLAAYAEARGTLSFSDAAAEHLPALAGSSFDTISLLDLGTYTAGGLPLQFPDEVTNEEQMIAYYRRWRPAYAPGTHRLYSNPSIGLFGYLAARSLGASFADLMEREILPPLGLGDTYVRVPKGEMDRYALGTSRSGRPARLSRGVFGAEAYGVKTTAADLVRFAEANMAGAAPEGALGRAVAATHTGYYTVGGMTQGLGWEMYAYPTELETLVAGNSPEMAREPHAVARLVPPQPPEAAVLINKTGSTNGFGAYVAFVPAKRIGVAILANRPYPNAARVKAAHAILAALDTGAPAP